jgi:hypothetical protein
VLSDSVAPSEPATEPVAEPVTEPVTEPATEPVTEAVTGPTAVEVTLVTLEVDSYTLEQ